jgi:hypothetical protein
MTGTPTHLGAESFRRLFERSVSAPAPTDIPQPIVDWMSRLMLLEGLPFEYLVPHPAMLPEESIRFFLLDRNWLSRLIEGAASAGVGSSRDGLQLLSSLDELARQAAEHAPALRPAALGIAQPAANGDPWSGFLLRSTAVQGWPGMDVGAYDASGATLPTLRMDRLSPNVLLCIFQGVCARVDLMEPPETLHFGVLNQNKASDPDKAYYVVLRGLGANNLAAGVQLPGATARTASVALRPGGAAGVIDVARTAQSLKQGLSDNHALSPEGTFTSAEFAVEMVRAAGLQSFEQERP